MKPSVTFDPVPVRGGPAHGLQYAIVGGLVPSAIDLPVTMSGHPTQHARYSVETAQGIPVYLAFVGYVTP